MYIQYNEWTPRKDTLAGEIVETKFRSMNARVIQHEIDHLDGVLI